MFWNASNHQINIKSRCGSFCACCSWVAWQWDEAVHGRSKTRLPKPPKNSVLQPVLWQSFEALLSEKARSVPKWNAKILLMNYESLSDNMILYIQIGQLVDDQASSGSIWDGNLVWFRCLKVAQEPEVLAMSKWWYISVTCIYLEPVWPLFWGLNPPKEGLFQSKQGSFGFQVDMHRCSEFTLANWVLDVSWRRFSSRIGRNGLHRSLGWRGFRWIKHICHLQTPDIIHINSHLISLISQNCVYAYMWVVLGIMYNR